MQIRVVRDARPGCGSECAQWIAADGKIMPGTSVVFARILKSLGTRKLPVFIDSGGGSVVDAIAMGEQIRARHLDVVVATTSTDVCADPAGCGRPAREKLPAAQATSVRAVCASACVLVLAAGTRRVVSPWAGVGVHQMIVNRTLVQTKRIFRVMSRTVDGVKVEVGRTLVSERPISVQHFTVSASQGLYDKVSSYLAKMGIGHSLVPLMEATPPSGIHRMSYSELRDTGLVTDMLDGTDLLNAAEREARDPPNGTQQIATGVSGTAILLTPSADPMDPPKATTGRVLWSLLRVGADKTARTVLRAAVGVHEANLDLLFDLTPGIGHIGIEMSFKLAGSPIKRIDKLDSVQIGSNMMHPIMASGPIQRVDPTTFRTQLEGDVATLSKPALAHPGPEFHVHMLADGARPLDLIFPIPEAALLDQAAKDWTTSYLEETPIPVLK